MTEVFEINRPPAAELDVVFVHGLDGDARRSWVGPDGESFWPDWLSADIPEAAVWTVGYDAWSSGWRGRSMSLPDRAVNLLALLQNHDIGERPLCFVTHSMGGLLVKEMLLLSAEGRSNFRSVAKNIRGVVFLATPHTGSGVAKSIAALRQLYRSTPAVEDLERNGSHLRQLNDRYRDWVAETGTATLVLYETRPTSGLRIVDESSSNPGIAHVRPIPVDADHVSICKPASRREVVYGQVRRFISDLKRPARPSGPERGRRNVDVAGSNFGTIIAGDGNRTGI